MTTAVERQTLSYDAEIQDASIKDRILAHAISFIISLSFFFFFFNPGQPVQTALF